MKLIHYAAEIVDSVNPCCYLQDPEFEFKPSGFWVSVETGDPDDRTWKDWCIAEEFSLERFRYAYEVHLMPDANILRIGTVAEMYGLMRTFWNPKATSRYEAIDWGAVASAYQGILIVPYQYQLRLHPDFSWYYTWDCASGCIWDVSAIARIELCRKQG